VRAVLSFLIQMIREFYKDRTILLTGATGFLGKGIAAKLLRDLPEVRRIYTLVRPGKQDDGSPISVAQRLQEELFDNSVFYRFKAREPERYAQVKEKIVPFAGDLTQPGLGIDQPLLQQLCDEVDLIVSSGATVDFDAPLDASIILNSLGPQELLGFARQCHKEVIFLHISTAYTYGKLTGYLAEEPLPLDRTIRQMMSPTPPETPFDPEAEIAACQEYCTHLRQRAVSAEMEEVFRSETLQESTRELTETRLEKLIDGRRKRWLERALVEEGMRRAKDYGWNDVYTFTKAMGEQMLVKHHGDIPLVIVRPSVIESSLADPEPGWISGLKVTDPLVVAYGRGQVPDFPARADVPMDLVPADIVVNIVLAAATQAVRQEVRVFHAATSGRNPLMNPIMFRYIRQHFDAHPMLGRDGKAPELTDWTFPSVRKFRTMFNLRYLYPLELRQWLYKYLPESWVPARKKRMLGAIRSRLNRVSYYTDLFSPYTHLDCRFECEKSQALFESLSPQEQDLFNMDVNSIDWAWYYPKIHLPGLRKHVLKEEGGGEPLLQEVAATDG